MRTPNLADRLSMANAAKKAQLERAKHMAEDPERAQRLKARDEIGAARNRRCGRRSPRTRNCKILQPLKRNPENRSTYVDHRPAGAQSSATRRVATSSVASSARVAN